MLFLYEHKFVTPREDHDEVFRQLVERGEVVELHDDMVTWTKLLDNPAVVSDEAGKLRAPVLTGARYFDEAPNRDKEHVDAVTCLVLDVDKEPVPDEAALRAALKGTRAIVYTSPSHTHEKPRWRVLLPLAAPLPPKKHRALVTQLSAALVPGFAGCIDVGATGDPCRLGFVSVTLNEADYTWFVVDGAPLDWRVYPLEDETWVVAPLGGLDRQETWTDRATALSLALKYFTTQGFESRGEHRTLILWHVAMELWWEWAAEDEDFVLTVMRAVNLNFAEAKDEDTIIRKMREAHKRTVGDRRREQISGGYGWRREPVNTSSVASIRHHAKRLKGRQKPELARLGDEMLRMIDGETVADDPETWRSALTRIAHDLARTFANDKKERLAQFFKPSLATMSATSNPVPQLGEIEGWLGAHLEGERRRREEMAERADDARRANISITTGGARETPYTQEEIDTWKATVGLHHRAWLLQKGKGTYVFSNGTWVGPYVSDEFEAVGYMQLEAAAAWVKFKTYNEEKGTTSFLPLSQLKQRYGYVCEPRINFMCESTYYRPEDCTLVVAGPTRTPLEPRFHDEVDEWFRVLTGRASPPDAATRREEASRDRSVRVVVPTPQASKPASKPASPSPVPSAPSAPSALSNRFAKAIAKAEAAQAAPPPPPSSSATGLKGRFGKVIAERKASTDLMPGPLSSRVAAVRAQKRRAPVVDNGVYEWVTNDDGDDYDTLCNWLACLMQLDTPCAALFLEGPNSVGKGLLADGIARLWKGGKIPLTSAFAHFNALLTQSPFIHVDEGLPKDMSASVLLRRVLAADEHVYTRKHVDSGKIDGCVRMLFTANNLDVFNKDKELLKKNDVDALSKRFVHIKARAEAATFLEKLGPRHHDFVKANMIAEHVLWLIEKRFAAIKKRDLRFLVKSRNENVSDVVATNDPCTSDVCSFVCSALVSGQKSEWFTVRRGSLWISAVHLQKQMALLDKNFKHTEREVTRAISSVSTGRRRSVQSAVGKKLVKMWGFRLDALRSWCRNTEVYDWEDVEAGLVRLNVVDTDDNNAGEEEGQHAEAT